MMDTISATGKGCKNALALGNQQQQPIIYSRGYAVFYLPVTQLAGLFDHLFDHLSQ
jgi:hypothetical protein